MPKLMEFGMLDSSFTSISSPSEVSPLELLDILERVRGTMGGSVMYLRILRADARGGSTTFPNLEVVGARKSIEPTS